MSERKGHIVSLSILLVYTAKLSLWSGVPPADNGGRWCCLNYRPILRQWR